MRSTAWASKAGRRATARFNHAASLARSPARNLGRGALPRLPPSGARHLPAFFVLLLGRLALPLDEAMQPQPHLFFRVIVITSFHFIG